MAKKTITSDVRKMQTSVAFRSNHCGRDGFYTDRGSLKLKPRMCKLMHDSGTFQGNNLTHYQGACPSHEIRLKTVCSRSYTPNYAVESLALCHCAEPCKSPTIGQLQEMRAIGGVIWRDSCILIIKPIDKAKY